MLLPLLRNLLVPASRPARRSQSSQRNGANVPILERLEDRCLLAVFTVTNTDDIGSGSLRQAIRDANANPGLDTIAFAIGDGGVQTIVPNSPLPTITDPVIIDGTTQPGFAGHPVIVLNGSHAGIANGLELAAGGCTVRGLVIQGFNFGARAGIEMVSGSGNLITGNYIGTDVTGTVAVGNGYGIIASDNNTIGGTEPGSGNLISGSLIAGLSIGSNNIVQGNEIGTDITGTQALGNGTGVYLSGGFPFGPLSLGNLIGGTVPGARNVISGNVGSGILITSANELAFQTPSAGRNMIQGDYIGTDSTGTQALGNSTGIFIIPGHTATVGNTLIGGTDTGAGNVISGNRVSGIHIVLSANNVVQGNDIGTDSTGTHAVGNQSYGLDFAQGSNNLVGGTTAEARNLISGNSIAGVHLIDNSARVQGNWIGTDSTGNAPLGNGSGIRVDGTGVTVGGTAAGVGNLISGNAYGVFLTGSGNRVQGNSIGTNGAGMTAVPNGYGVYIVGGSDNLIGGVDPGAGNVLSGNFTGVAIFSGQGNMVQGNRIGTDASGMLALRNGDGIELNGPNNLVGGTLAGAGNLISGNLQSGINISSSGNTIQGNLIGTTILGTGSLGNEDGVYIGLGATKNLVGGEAAGAGNLISGNRTAGVLVSGQANMVQGNLIGTDVTGTHALANLTGVRIEGGSDNLVGGTTALARNVISGNFIPSPQGSGEGILISAGQRNIVQGNYVGTDVSGSHGLANRTGIQILGGQGNQIGGTEPGAGNLISGNVVTTIEGMFGEGILVSQGHGNAILGNMIGTDVSGSLALGNYEGVILSDSNNTLGGTVAGAGNLISGNLYNGAEITGSRNRVQGNSIGTDASGTRALPNQRAGLVINPSTPNPAQNLIGGTEPGARNLVSGNPIGIELHGGPDNWIQGNYIGTDVTGSVALGNRLYGIWLPGASDSWIGGTSPGAGNVISGNGDSGLFLDISRNGHVQGNFIGTDATGTLAIPNGRGVRIESVLSNVIGGTEPGARNVISGNTGAGIDFPSVLAVNMGQQVQGNTIGTDVSGTLALPNGTGIRISASNITIGGTAAGADNLISGNTTDGVALLSGTGNVVQGNRIGVDVTGVQPLGNGGNGVLVGGNFPSAASNNLLGGTAGGAGNTIAFNGHDGILVIRGTGNAIRQNSIFSNGGLGIELLRGGNKMQPAPVLTAATSSGGITAIQGTLTSTPNTTFVIELFANTECDPSGFGEGERFLASLSITTDAAGTASFTVILAIPVDLGQFITATATDPAGNTSQFSNCVEVAMTGPPGVPIDGEPNTVRSPLDLVETRKPRLR